MASIISRYKTGPSHQSQVVLTLDLSPNPLVRIVWLTSVSYSFDNAGNRTGMPDALDTIAVILRHKLAEDRRLEPASTSAAFVSDQHIGIVQRSGIPVRD